MQHFRRRTCPRGTRRELEEDGHAVTGTLGNLGGSALSQVDRGVPQVVGARRGGRCPRPLRYWSADLTSYAARSALVEGRSDVGRYVLWGPVSSARTSTVRVDPFAHCLSLTPSRINALAGCNRTACAGVIFAGGDVTVSSGVWKRSRQQLVRQFTKSGPRVDDAEARAAARRMFNGLPELEQNALISELLGDFAVRAAADAARERARRQNASTPLLVSCPTCNVPPGELCRGSGERGLAKRPHSERRKKWRSGRWDASATAPKFKSGSVRQDGRALRVSSVHSGGLPERNRRK